MIETIQFLLNNNNIKDMLDNWDFGTFMIKNLT